MNDHLKATGSPSEESDALAAKNFTALDELGVLIDGRIAEIAILRKHLRRYRAAMENVCDELEEDFDTVDGGDGQPAPNKAMRLASELKEAMYGPGGY